MGSYCFATGTPEHTGTSYLLEEHGRHVLYNEGWLNTDLEIMLIIVRGTGKIDVCEVGQQVVFNRFKNRKFS